MEQFVQFVVNHWGLWLALAGVIGLIILDEILSAKFKPMSLSTQQAVDNINKRDAKVIDLRSESAFQNGHIINAIRASEEDFSRPKLEKLKDKPIILVDDKGLKSSSVANKLKRLGYKDVMLLKGGMSAWQEANLPLTKGKK